MDAVPLQLLFYIGWNWGDRRGGWAIAVENVGARHPQMITEMQKVTIAVPRHQQIIGKNEKCNCRRAPATGAPTRSPGVGDGEGDRDRALLADRYRYTKQIWHN